MGLGIKIGNNKVIELGQIREELIHVLESENIKFNIMFDKINSEKDVKETVIYIQNLNIEISLSDDVVDYIKSKESKYSILEGIDISTDKIDRINNILAATKKYFNTDKITINDMNMSNFDIRVIIKEDTHKYRVHIMTTQKGESFIYTMKII